MACAPVLLNTALSLCNQRLQEGRQHVVAFPGGNIWSFLTNTACKWGPPHCCSGQGDTDGEGGRKAPSTAGMFEGCCEGTDPSCLSQGISIICALIF